MAPRKSTSRASRPSQATRPIDTLPQPVASSSKITLDAIPALDVPASITPEYVPPARKRQELTEDQRGRLVHELVGFHPRSLCDDITEAARFEIYTTIGGIEGWTTSMAEGKGEAYEREVDMGLHSIETLLESHVDKAFDRFTAWALRNTFDIPSDVEAVLPWHAGLDFSRGEFVASLPRGEETLSAALEDMRLRVEQARYLSQQLEVAEAKLDRRIEIAKQRKAEVGFVHEIIQSAGVSPLPQTSTQIHTSLTALHTSLAPLEIPSPSIPQPTPNTKAWELGRQAYLNWAIGKMVHGDAPGLLGGSGEGKVGAGAKGNDRMEEVETEMVGVGDMESIEAMGKVVGL